MQPLLHLNRATWLGARWCSNTGASRYSATFSLSLLPTTFASIVILLVFSDYLNFSLTPQSNSHPSNQFHRRDWEFLLSNPATDRVPTNAHDLCDFNGRMSSHLNNGIGLCDVSSKKRTRTGASSTPIRVNESISQNVLECRRSLLWIFLRRRSAHSGCPRLWTLQESQSRELCVIGTVCPSTGVNYR